MILFVFIAELFGPPSRAKCICELGNCENAFAVEFLTILSVHASQQAEVIFFGRDLPATLLKFTLGTMPDQNQVRRRLVGKQPSNFLKVLPHFVGEARGLQLHCGVVVSVNDLTDGYLPGQHSREHKGVEGEEEPVVFGDLVEEGEADGDELCRLAPAFGWHAFHGMDIGFKNAGIHR